MIDILAWAGAGLSGVLCVPQALRAFRAEQLAGVSPATYWLTLANAMVWLVWALCTGQLAVGASAAVSGPAAVLVLLRLRSAGPSGGDGRDEGCPPPVPLRHVRPALQSDGNPEVARRG